MYQLESLIDLEYFKEIFKKKAKRIKKNIYVINSKDLRERKKYNNIKQFNHQLVFRYDDFVICDINKIK
jgi:hypothetical protein